MQNKVGFKYLVLSLLLVLLLPANTATAKASAPVRVDLYNRTGAPATLTFTNADGIPSYFDVIAGYSTVELTEGTYDFRVNTTCGGTSGSMNLSVSRRLYMDCTEGQGPVLGLANRRGFAGGGGVSCLYQGVVTSYVYLGSPMGDVFYDFSGDVSFIPSYLAGQNEWVLAVIELYGGTTSYIACLNSLDNLGYQPMIP